ncbi:hypothetical protein SELMODRAFT_122894 [Selaginella moellendorffii]|uniref:Alpha/beta hydrolase fold-3 domain-containing protein n=1 Tax=Selaginella moellendorffii TaxID=88036 RepID=D8SQP5_SELML|nr:carboxylesterase 1 [Selaginella moellendorffii]EFJ13199.1 hypothetical protein SELMODRAFT_122894 [Selaginella moellendorffii]|eukprot:XP_002985621.1 carboxylesterase 1 [Selaginella moellendorffii]
MAACKSSELLALNYTGVPGLFDVLPDGSVIRSDILSPSIAANSSSFTRDVLVDRGTGLQVRIFLPAAHSACKASTLSIIVYFHGGGFCMWTADTLYVHNFCAKLARAAHALVVSVSYRLAPEHRLPAAYEDGARVLQWLAGHKDSSHSFKLDEPLDPWIVSLADFSQCFLMGEGAGANLIHHVMLGRREKSLPVHGLILVNPLFGGEERTPSEVELEKTDMAAPVGMLDELWKYCLPLGADRNHHFSNPFGDEVAKSLSEAEFPRALLVVPGRGSLQDRQFEYFNLLKSLNKDVLLLFLKNAAHGFEYMEGQVDQAKILLQFTVQFMAEKTSKVS